MSFAIVTDTSANVPLELVRAENIQVLSLECDMSGVEKKQSYLDDKEFDSKAFYDAMRAGAKVRTSQINPQSWMDCMEKPLSQGQDVLMVGMSSGISGSFASAQMAAAQLSEDYPERSIRLVDSLGASLGEGLLVVKAIELRREGKSLEEVYEHLSKLLVRMYQVFTVDDLNYLRRGGRLSNAAAIAGIVLNIKPILKGNENGKIISIEKIRGRKRTIERLAEKYDELVFEPENQVVGISHADCLEDAQKLIELISRNKPPKEIMLVDHEPATGSYLGPGALALYFAGNEECRYK